MRILSVLIAATYAACVCFAETVNFDKASPGLPPPGWTATKTGTGEAHWTIEKDDTAPSKPNVLKQSGQATYPVCIKDDTSLKDGFVEVKFKPISGKEDQAGGLIWRAKDSNNYYVARANALEDNVAIYNTVNGRRTERKRTNIRVAPNQWHSLRVDFQGNHFVVTFDGKKAVEWDDTTFAEAGKVGVWTKADSVTLFDDFTIGDLNTANRSVPAGKTLAQRLVDDLAKKHPELVRIGLHVTPPGSSDNIIVASNIPSKIGQKSDPEDLKAMEVGRPVVLKEGNNFDVTLPLHDAAGSAIGAIGLTFPPKQSERETDALKRANTIAHELEKQIPSRENLF